MSESFYNFLKYGDADDVPFASKKEASDYMARLLGAVPESEKKPETYVSMNGNRREHVQKA